MKISTEIASIAKLVGEYKAVELCAKAGFDGWDFSMIQMGGYDWKIGACVLSEHPLCGSNCLQFARHLRKIGEDNGIRCNQSHAPFPVKCKQIRDLLPVALECTAEAGGEICVIHPDNNKSAEENAQMYLELLPFAKSVGVKIATENMWNWNAQTGISSFAACATSDDFREHLDLINDDFFVACLDIGHAEMQGSGSGAVNMIHTLGDKLQAVHLHDNNLRNDNHQIPYSMNIDFEAVIQALKAIDYKGWFTLEANAYLKNFNTENVFRGVQDMAAAAKKLVKSWQQLENLNYA